MNKVEVVGKVIGVDISSNSKGKVAHVYIDSEGAIFQVAYWDDKADKAKQKLLPETEVKVTGELSVKHFDTRDGKSSVSLNINKPDLRIIGEPVLSASTDSQKTNDMHEQDPADTPYEIMLKSIRDKGWRMTPTMDGFAYIDDHGNTHHVDKQGKDQIIVIEGEDILDEEDDDVPW